jgi:predicted ATPase/class 3 adenylate cyclase
MANPMQSLPAGTVTFLFTDIEGSTQLWDQHPEAMKAALARHDSILKTAVASNHGQVLQMAGDGLHAVFETPAQGVAAMLAAQRALRQYAWDEIKPQAIRVRMGLHTGEAELRDGDYYGGALNRAARIMAAGHGGQVLLSAATAELVRRQLSADTTLIDLGEHHLKGLLQSEHIFQVSAPDLAAEFPSLNSLSAATHNLPTQLTTFIGRERELTETQAELGSARLLTLIGPGGTGKTRLALELAATQLDRFKDGVWLVELAPIVDPAFIVSTIAAVFELREAQGIPLMTLVIDYLRAKELLLVLDNCEHLVEASGRIVDQLLHACGQLKIIASSREALGIAGETVYRVPSLSLPDQPSGDLMKYEATRLFIERAKKAEPRFRATTENAPAIIQICQRLDGIPLAIELAAARVKLFTPEQIAERLDDRFKLLTGGSRTALPRQQTLRALIDWSYHSLNEPEQRVLRRLAVFSGGWTIEGAEAVVGEAEALDGLLGLVNKSLVNVAEQSGAARYRFLETIRQYAMEKLLESDEATGTRNRHLDYVMKLAGEPRPGVLGTQRLSWLDQMEVEHDNLRAALEWSSSNDLPKAIPLALALGEFWAARDYNNEAVTWCQTILDRSGALTALAAPRASLYAVLAQTAIYAGHHKPARSAATAGLALAEQAADRPALVRLYALLGLSAMYLGDLPSAQQALRSGEVLARELALTGELSMILILLTQINYFTGADQDLTRANAAEAESLTMQAGSQWSNVMVEFAFARLSGLLGDVEKARALFKRSAEAARRTGNLRVVYSCQSELAHILRHQGQIDEALALYREVLPKWKGLGHRSAVAHELECMAFILGQKDETDRALTLLGAAEALRAAIDATMTKPERLEYDEVISALHTQVDENRFKQLWDAGRSMDMERSIAYALEPAGTVH